MTVLVRCTDTYRPEREYIVGLVLSTLLGLEHRFEWSRSRDVRLTIDGDPSGRVLLLPDVLFQTAGEDWLTERSTPRLPLRRRDAREVLDTAPQASLPVLFGEGGARGPVVAELDGGLRLSVDVFGGAFYMLTRYEELVSPDRDEHGRFPLSAALAHRAGFVHRAVADEYVDMLSAVMARLWPALARPARRVRCLLTHDVDVPFSVRTSLRRRARMIGGDVVRRGDPALAARRVRACLARDEDLARRDPAFTFDFILGTGDRYGVQSSFYFLAEPGGPKPARYSLHEPWARALIRRIADRGHCIGLHGSYTAYRDPAALRRELRTLVAVAEAEGVAQEEWGGRQHWLRWENPATWRACDEAGLDYDATVGFEEEPGFRCGTCHPFPVFDLRRRQALRLVEHPLQFMDTTVFDRDGSATQAVTRALSAYETCKRHGGELVLLWHNDSLAPRRRRAAYTELVRELS